MLYSWPLTPERLLAGHILLHRHRRTRYLTSAHDMMAIGDHCIPSDTLYPVERDELLSIESSLAVLPWKPRSNAGGCTNKLTQTTENQSSQGRVRPYYYFDSKSLCRYVGATSLRLDPAPTQEATFERAKHSNAVHVWKDAGQRACTVPAERYQHGYSHEALQDYSNTEPGKWKPIHPCSRQGTALSSQSASWEMGLPVPVC